MLNKPFMFFVLFAEFSTSPTSPTTGGFFDGATVGVVTATVVATGVEGGAVVTPVAKGPVVGLGASVTLVTGARNKSILITS